MTEQQHLTFLMKVPLTSDKQGLDNLGKPPRRLVEVTQELTFDMFWDRYEDKANSSKHKTKERWNNMPKAEQVKAYNFINTYNRQRMNRVPVPGKKLAETYLNSKIWNN